MSTLTKYEYVRVYDIEELPPFAIMKYNCWYYTLYHSLFEPCKIWYFLKG